MSSRALSLFLALVCWLAAAPYLQGSGPKYLTVRIWPKNAHGTWDTHVVCPVQESQFKKVGNTTEIQFRRVGMNEWVGFDITKVDRIEYEITDQITPNVLPQEPVAPKPSAGSAGTFPESQATYSGAWSQITQPQLEGGSAMRTTQAGASATFTFRGGSILLISKTQPDAGAADVFIDGQKVMELAQFQGPNKWEDRAVVLLKSGLNPNQDHELKIVHNGKANPYGKPAWVTIDGFQVRP